MKYVLWLPCLPLSHSLSYSNSINFEQKLLLFWINLFSSGETYSVLTDNLRNATCSLWHELSHAGTDLSVGCWDSTVHAALSADVQCPPWLSWAQGKRIQAAVLQRRLPCLECYCRIVPASAQVKGHAFTDVAYWHYLYISSESPLAICLTSLIILDMLCYYEGNLWLHLNENKKDYRYFCLKKRI